MCRILLLTSMEGPASEKQINRPNISLLKSGNSSMFMGMMNDNVAILHIHLCEY